MKYFFLSEGWIVGRVWGTTGMWDNAAWRRPPEIQLVNVCILENEERLWLHQVEEAVLMLEVKPDPFAIDARQTSIGQVMIKRLISAEQVIELLSKADILNSKGLTAPTSSQLPSG